MRFVGRERELGTLESLYKTASFQMPVVYGRRRVGKTSLLNEFIKGKRGVVFTARETSAKENLGSLSRALYSLASNRAGGDDIDAGSVFTSFEAAFERLFQLSLHERVVFVIDEYPYLAQSDPSVSSVLQSIIDREKDVSQLFLVLCGSSMSFMEHQVLGHQSPLYGRRTAQIKVDPFDIFDSADLISTDAQSAVGWYGMVGGIPLYLDQYDTALDIQGNMSRNLLRRDSFLFGEPDSYLMQELRDPSTYNAIITTIASGVGRLSEIADTAGVSRGSLPAYLGTLEELGVVRRDEPVFDANRKKVRYRICDNLFRFWYRFVPRYLTPLEAGMNDDIAALITAEHLSTYLGASFEEVCRQWLVRGMGTDDIPLILKLGRWWGADPRESKEAEIDIAAACDDGSVILGECKWRNRLCDAEVVERLVYRSELIAGEDKRLMVFSKSGFTEQAYARAEEEGVRMIALSEMGISPVKSEDVVL